MIKSANLRFAIGRAAKHVLIRAGLEIIALSHVDRWLPAAGGRGVIFTLHHVRPDRGHRFDPTAHLSVSPEFLESAILIALRRGLYPVRLEDLPALLADPSDTRRFVCFTLDDGFRDNAEFAAPIFRKYDVPFTIFIVPGFVERTRTIWWETVEEWLRAVPSLIFDFGQGLETVPCATPLQKFAAFVRFARYVWSIDEDVAIAAIDRQARLAGIDPGGIVEREILAEDALRDLARDPLVRFGAHTLTHPILARVDDQRLAAELEPSAARIARYVGQQPTALAYPYGGQPAVHAREIEAAREAGFVLAVTTQSDILRADSLKRPTELPRISLNGHYQRRRYVRALISGIPFIFRRARRAPEPTADK